MTRFINRHKSTIQSIMRYDSNAPTFTSKESENDALLFK